MLEDIQDLGAEPSTSTKNTLRKNMISKKCKLHVEKAGMTRWQHFKRALWISWQLEKAAYACFIHAFVPRWFETYASSKCKEVLDSK
tara:strand:+ start:1039 stop:1299 length:261 start_codon:yes stop_codon:yes gene_type:complete